MKHVKIVSNTFKRLDHAKAFVLPKRPAALIALIILIEEISRAAAKVPNQLLYANCVELETIRCLKFLNFENV